MINPSTVPHVSIHIIFYFTYRLKTDIFDRETVTGEKHDKFI